MHSWAKQKAFTIVELLIVIVVIAILAAITIVAYTGIQDRAKSAALASAASQASKKILAYAALNTDLFPPDEATFFSSTNLADTSDLDYTYLTSPDRTHYCISATNPNNPSLSTAVSDTSSGTVEGRCVRNMVRNPSFEVDRATWGYASSYTALSRPVASGGVGTAYLAVERTATGDAYAYSNTESQPITGETYTASFLAWATGGATTAGNTLFRYYPNGVCCSNLDSRSSMVVAGSPQRVVLSGAQGPDSTAGIGQQLIIRPTNTIGQKVYYDAFMITLGSTVYQYGDGSFAGWSWDGSPNNSSSFGPAKIQS